MRKKTIAAVVLGLAVALAGVGAARADECGAGCGVGTVACMKSARADRAGCRASCRQASGRKARGACMRACIGTFRGARGTCGSDHADCVATCPPSGSPPDACEGACGQALGSCAHGVIATAKSCLQGCGVSFHHESEDGNSQGGQSGEGDGGACAHACASAARSGLEGCRSDFETCIGACGGSPSGAFVD